MVSQNEPEQPEGPEPVPQDEPKFTPAQQEILNKAEQLKQEANELFKNKNYADACAKYFAAID